MDLEDFCDIMQRHQPENLIVTNSGGSDGDDSDGDGSNNSDDGNDGGAGGRGNRKGAGGGGSGGAGGGGGKVSFTREEVISNLVELFKEVKDHDTIKTNKKATVPMCLVVIYMDLS